MHEPALPAGGAVAHTGVSVVQSGPTSKLTSRLYNSVTGAWKSQRSPTLTEKLLRIRQSSVTKRSAHEARKYLSAPLGE